MNDAGIHFPIWGTCNGFEILVTLVNDFVNVLSHIDDEEGINHKLSIIKPGQFPGVLYESMPNKLLNNAEDKKLQFFNHENTLLTESYVKAKKLTSFFNLSATAESINGVNFVATLEAKHYPIFAV